jgi:SAM-dependent methyltransferase
MAGFARTGTFVFMLKTAIIDTTDTTERQNTTEQPAAGRAPWFASWFDSHYYHKLYAHRDDTEAARFIDALIARLRPEGAASILDLGCGAGRHSKYLASKGYAVTGLDLAAASIREARQAAAPGLRFRRHDMREPFGERVFDYVFNMFTSFGYFEAPEEHDAVVHNIAHALRPGGRLVLDYLNVRYADSRLTPRETRVIDGVTYRVTRWTDDRHFFKRITIDAGDRTDAHPVVEHVEHLERVARFGRGDFERMFARHGLAIEAVYGDYALNAYDEHTSPRLILIARRSLGDASGLLPGQILPDAA